MRTQLFVCREGVGLGVGRACVCVCVCVCVCGGRGRDGGEGDEGRVSGAEKRNVSFFLSLRRSTNVPAARPPWTPQDDAPGLQ